VFAALLLCLAGASHEVIAYDYSLTRVGVEPRREMLWEMLKMWNKDWTEETPGMAEFVQVRDEFILAFLNAVDKEYGSVEAYVRDVLGFSEEEVGVIKRVLRGEHVRGY
jgi:protein tyrosine/serine phosphatase